MTQLHVDDLILEPLTKWIFVACLVIGAGACVTSCYRHKAIVAIEQANIEHGRADAQTATARALDEKAKEQAAIAKDAQARVDQLRAEVARLRVPKPASPAAPTVEPVSPVLPSVDLVPLVAKLDELVQAQDHEISALKGQLETVTHARDSWRLTAESSGREALQLRASLAAKEGLIKGALWKGRVQGLAVGIGSGYLAGRLH